MLSEKKFLNTLIKYDTQNPVCISLPNQKTPISLIGEYIINAAVYIVILHVVSKKIKYFLNGIMKIPMHYSACAPEVDKL